MLGYYSKTRGTEGDTDTETETRRTKEKRERDAVIIPG